MTWVLALIVLVLAATGAWRLRVLGQDIAVLDREMEKLHGHMSRARHERAEMVRQADQRHRTVEVATSEISGELARLRRRVDGMEPWVAMWASADQDAGR